MVKRRSRIPRLPPYSIAQQDAYIRSRFPGFRFHKNRHCWVGAIKSDQLSRAYTLRITYRLGRIPKVTVDELPRAEYAKHTYADGSLCLYYPEDEGAWHDRAYIAETLIPWACEWLVFYEHWKVTGDWLGKEAPHDPDTVK
jgi:hypothetical protein